MKSAPRRPKISFEVQASGRCVVYYGNAVIGAIDLSRDGFFYVPYASCGMTMRVLRAIMRRMREMQDQS